MKPVRIRRKRTKGFQLQHVSRALNGLEAVSVTRPGRWGNPYKIGIFMGYCHADAVADFKKWLAGDIGCRSYAGPPPEYKEIRAQLRGKNLACFCKEGQPCHGDVLLEIANS